MAAQVLCVGNCQCLPCQHCLFRLQALLAETGVHTRSFLLGNFASYCNKFCLLLETLQAIINSSLKPHNIAHVAVQLRGWTAERAGLQAALKFAQTGVQRRVRNRM